jgi:DNA-binding NarL/FixJ family response regulator
MEKTMLVGIAEDQSMLRKRLIEHFRYFDHIEVTLAASSGNELLERLEGMPQGRRPQVILMDIEMPGHSGIETTALVKERYPEIDILMFTVFEDDERIFEAIKAGASGYLLKDEPADIIVDSLRELEAGGAPMSALIARKMLGLMRKAAIAGTDILVSEEAQGNPFDLSDREVEIVQQLVLGKTNVEIGRDLFLSPFTVKTHIKNIYRKMHVGSRAEAASLAFRNNLV